MGFEKFFDSHMWNYTGKLKVTKWNRFNTDCKNEQEGLDVLHIRPRSRLREAFLLNFTERLSQFSWRRIREQEEK